MPVLVGEAIPVLVEEASEPPTPVLVEEPAAEPPTLAAIAMPAVPAARSTPALSSLYPPGPSGVPADFTQPTPKYRREVTVVLTSLVLSFLFYLFLVIGSAWLCYWLITASWPPPPPRGQRGGDPTVIFRVVGIICLPLLFLYLLKGLFKVSRPDPSLQIEITEAEQPELFAFIRQICHDTGAPPPSRVYVSPEVNAAVFYQSSVLSLVMPTPKNLLIGLGLVNVLNLSEFKAVLAHEFGHFSQKSMKVSAYVYIANKVFADINDEDLTMPLMWSTHPPNCDREAVAKENYLPAVIDERSAWLLFRDRDDLCARMSSRYYAIVHKLDKEPELADAARVQSFLNEEYAETSYPERYHGFYDNRYLELKETQPVIDRAARDGRAAAAIVQELDATFGPELETWVKESARRLDDMDILSGLQAGALSLKTKTLEFRGESCSLADIPRLLEMVQLELDHDKDRRAQIDGLVFADHVRLANLAGGPFAQELIDRYVFHLNVQQLHPLALLGLDDLRRGLDFAANHPEMTEQELADLGHTLEDAAGSLQEIADRTQGLVLPALKNMEASSFLRPFLFQKPVVGPPPLKNIPSPWIEKISAQLTEVEDRLKRLLFKSLGGILALQTRIVDAAAKG
jgi:Zn-dependent protease with chaperone function